MTQQETTDDLVQRFRATLEDRETAARAWERLAQQMRVSLNAERKRADGLRDERAGALLMADAWESKWKRLAEVYTREMDQRMQAQDERDHMRRWASAWKRAARTHRAARRALRFQRDHMRDERDVLAHLVGTETPIAALTLAATWQTERAHMQARIAELEADAAACALDSVVFTSARDV